MFERAHHQRIAQVLACLDATLLTQHHCLFGGGTAMALRFGEYRESVDMDFLVSDLAGFRTLRQLLTGPDGLRAICHASAPLHTLREVRADQYGIRTAVTLDTHTNTAAIKFEVILEARMALATPGKDDQVCGIATLTPLDMAASKLLANSDRWADDSVFSRDVIDLAMMQPSPTLRREATNKASGAYGDSIMADLTKSINHLLGRHGRLERCMQALQITAPKAVLWQRVQALLPKKSRSTE